MLTAEDYTVAWICAITPEYYASKLYLDEICEAPANMKGDPNYYIGGRMGKHNVVIASLYEGKVGLCSATNVAGRMANTFPNLRICLLVGVAGGAPSAKHDIRLGDVVVSYPSGTYGGVFQYDFMKT